MLEKLNAVEEILTALGGNVLGAHALAEAVGTLANCGRVWGCEGRSTGESPSGELRLTMITSESVKTALRVLLPATHHAHIANLAKLVAEAASGFISTDDVQAHLAAEPAVASLLQGWPAGQSKPVRRPWPIVSHAMLRAT